MGINFDTGFATAIYKQRYSDKKVETISFVSPTVAMMPKNPNGGGKSWIGAIRIATASSRSATASTAFTVGSPSTYDAWNCAWANDYASANITGAVIDQANGDQNSLVNSIVSEFDGAFITLGESAGSALFGNGGGSIGVISASSSVGTPTITLATPSQIVNFKIGQVLQAASDDGTGGAGVRTGTVTVTGVNINTGTVTASGNWSAGISAIAAGDNLFMDGDYNGKLIGLPGWIPSTDPTSTLFNGVNRSVDPTRLAGCRFTGGGRPKSESLTQLSTLTFRMGGKPDKLVCNSLDYADLQSELGSRVQFISDKAFANPQIGFPAMQVATPYGMIAIHQDPYCPQGQAWLLQMNTWELVSMGKFPKALGRDVDGLEWLRNQSDDSYQSRFGYRATTYCSAPGWNGTVTW